MHHNVAGSTHLDSDTEFYESADEQRLDLRSPLSFESHFKGGALSSAEAKSAPTLQTLLKADSNELRTFTETTLEKRSLINQTLNSITIDPSSLLPYTKSSSTANFYPNRQVNCKHPK